MLRIRVPNVLNSEDSMKGYEHTLKYGNASNVKIWQIYPKLNAMLMITRSNWVEIFQIRLHRLALTNFSPIKPQLQTQPYAHARTDPNRVCSEINFMSRVVQLGLQWEFKWITTWEPKVEKREVFLVESRKMIPQRERERVKDRKRWQRQRDQ